MEHFHDRRTESSWLAKFHFLYRNHLRIILWARLIRTFFPSQKRRVSLYRSDDHLSLTQTYTRSTCTIRPVIIIIIIIIIPLPPYQH